MKRIICLVLSILMLLLASVSVLAEGEKSEETTYRTLRMNSPFPIILMSGDGDPLYNTDGEQVLHYKSLLNGSANTDEDSENIKESIMNVLYPFLTEGVLTNRWDNYYSALQKEVSELMEDSLLDENGNPSNGTSISQARWDKNRSNMNTDKKKNGVYKYNDYYYYYDWRLDPLENADVLHEYITALKETTGSEKVGVISRCLGTSLITAYVAKYGMDDLYGVAFDGGIVNGAEIISEPISGRLNIDLNAINRFLEDCNALGLFDIDSFITASVDLLDKNGVFDAAIGVTKATVYKKLVEGVTSALALSTFFTWPSYWAAVTIDDYDTALNYVFGEEGSEKRVKYAGLIEKIENYNTVVRQNLPSIFEEIADNGNICVISKYGFQIGPICESSDEIGDQFASVYRSSYGATTADVYSTLDEAYINRRINEGRANHISPDKKIDATTCLFPDNTWFVKNVSHSTWSNVEHGIMTTVLCAERQLTVDDFELSQFMVWDSQADTVVAMTEENCHTENWTADTKTDRPSNIFERIVAYFKSLINWIKEAFRFIEENKQAQTTQAA